MRVLVIINDISQGGAEKLLVSSLILLKSKNLDVELLVLNGENSVPDYLAILKKAAIPVHDLHASSFYHPGLILKIRKFLSSRSFDVIHVHLFPALYWAGAAVYFLRRKPFLVYTEHSNHNQRRDKKYLKLAERKAYSPYSAIIAITESVRQNLVEWIGQSDKVITIPNGVDLLTMHRTQKQNKIELCSQLGIPADAKVMLMAAAFRYPKDQTTIVKACKILGNDYHILLAGEGELKEATVAMAAGSGISDQVHFLGFRTDISMLMKSVDLNILSSDYEGMSGVTLESLAAEVPFLGSNVPGIREVVPNDSFLFNAGDEKNLAEKISLILRDSTLNRAMIEDATNYIKSFDMELMANKYLALYERLIMSRQRNINSQNATGSITSGPTAH